jgi:hypothetical protein
MMARQVADTLISENLNPIASSNSGPDTTASQELNIEILKEKAGLFWNEKSKTAVGFTVTDEKLYLDHQNVHYEMMPISDLRFRMQLTGMIIEFSPDTTYVTTFVGQDGETKFIRTEGFKPDKELILGYVGTYQSEELEVLYRLFLDDDGQLTLKFLKSEPHTLKPHMQDVFVGNFGTLRFQRDDNMIISGFTITSGRIRNLAFNKM